MKLSNLGTYYQKHPFYKEIITLLSEGKKNIHLKGFSGSSTAVFLAALLRTSRQTHFFVLPDKEEAGYFFNDLENLLTGGIYFLPSSYKRDLISLKNLKKAEESIIERNKTIEKLNAKEACIIISYPEAIIEKEVSSKIHQEQSFLIKVGDKLDTAFIKEFLFEYGFRQNDFVYAPGDFSVRGSIIDVFSYSNEHPYRIDFFGDEVDSIRTFDIMNQLSIEQVNQIILHPDVNQISESSDKLSIFDHLPDNSVLWLKDSQYIAERLNQLKEKITKENFEQFNEDYVVLKPDDFISGKDFISELNKQQIIELGNRSLFPIDKQYIFQTQRQAEFNKNFDLLASDMYKRQTEGYQNFILSDQEKQIERISSILQSEEVTNHPEFKGITPTLHEGFIDHDVLINCYTDHQIFQRYHRLKLKSQKMIETKGAISLQELNQLKPGDYVIHVDHGIGKFAGLQSIEVNGKQQETIRISYKDQDTLFVSIHSLHKISKYKGGDGIPPKIHKLGSKVWQNTKNKVKSRVKDIAKELIALYAKRKAEKGFQFSPDSYLQEALEASFIYEDTPDQYKAAQATKADMEAPIPMDRLICGDVGFGKTEVAIRAAFKAVTDGKQVAVLVPTTILALQHYQTFSKRLKDLPCTVEYISRLKPAKQQKIILEKLKKGEIDILIGTHRIVGKDVVFKDLGLLVIDEEQKFGVAIKEKLKQLKLNVDTLTLTATPIPRTLQFSLIGARDLSIINTPPPNRYPIVTELHTFNEEIIKEALENELRRNGQIFFINNRVQQLPEIEILLKRLVPQVRTVIAHGQMKGNELEKIMLDFINHEYDVLIATTIIESGLDIPNANTIIINNAQNFGLSDLHQLRGRVGRSNKKAFCYLLAPPLTVLTPEARKRLRAIEEYSDLGSGFNIAMQDLDIRGAGNLLGGEQSGFIAEIGFETYQQILNEALFELREEAPETQQSANYQAQNDSFTDIFVHDCQIDTDMEILFPNDYISSTSERIRLYRELDNLKTDEELEIFTQNLIDRFGELPPQSQELITLVKMRRLAMKLGIIKIILKKEQMICYFYNSERYFNSDTFGAILSYANTHYKTCNMPQDNKKPRINISNIKSIKQAYATLQKIMNN